MRALLLLVFGALLGAGGMMAYVVFGGAPPAAPAEALPKHPPITVTLGAPFLEQIVRRAAEEAPGLGLSKDDLRVTLRDREIVVSAMVDVVGKQTRGTIVMRPVLERGKLRFDVVNAGLGGMPLPKVGQLVEQHVDARVRALMNSMPITVTGAKVDKARGLSVTGNVDLARLEATLQR